MAWIGCWCILVVMFGRFFPKAGTKGVDIPGEGEFVRDDRAMSESGKVGKKKSKKSSRVEEERSLEIDSVMDAEDQLLMRERMAVVEAGEQELAIRQSVRRAGVGLGVALIRGTNTLNRITEEFERRVTIPGGMQDMPLVQLTAVARAVTSAQETGLKVMRAAVELEREIQKNPLGDPMAGAGDDHMDLEEAKEAMEKIERFMDRQKRNRPTIVAENIDDEGD